MHDSDRWWPRDETDDEEAERALQEEIDAWEEGRPAAFVADWGDDDLDFGDDAA